MKKNRKNSSGIKRIVLLILIFLIGFSIFSYPFLSNWVSVRQAAMRIGEYERNVSYLSEEERVKYLNKAVEYNNALIGIPVKDPFIQGSGVQLPQNYLDILDVSDVMAYIEIPKINTKLPIYHGVSEEVLLKGVGHMEGSSFPVGGAGTHCLLTGHTGLPEAELFSNLTELEIGDQFYIMVLGKELVYQVDQIKVILPDDLGMLYLDKREDYVTLITCTPYGVNSHRLLVRGSRVNQMLKSIALSKEDSWIYLLVFGLSAVLSVILFWICCKDYIRKKRSISDRVSREDGSHE